MQKEDRKVLRDIVGYVIQGCCQNKPKKPPTSFDKKPMQT
jgi:hypothetical protein